MLAFPKPSDIFLLDNMELNSFSPSLREFQVLKLRQGNIWGSLGTHLNHLMPTWLVLKVPC